MKIGDTDNVRDLKEFYPSWAVQCVKCDTEYDRVLLDACPSCQCPSLRSPPRKVERSPTPPPAPPKELSFTMV